MDLTGKIIRKLNVQKGVSQRGEWQKQEFVIEYQDGQYHNNVCFNVWGADKVAELAGFSEGETVRVSFNISSREYAGRWYTDVRAWRIERAGDAQQAAPVPTPAPAAAPAPAPAPSAEPDEDDLPF